MSAQNHETTLRNIGKATLEVTPPAGLAVWHWLVGLPIQNWVAALAIVYTLLQIIVLVRKEFFKRSGKKSWKT